VKDYFSVLILLLLISLLVDYVYYTERPTEVDLLTQWKSTIYIIKNTKKVQEHRKSLYYNINENLRNKFTDHPYILH